MKHSDKAFSIISRSPEETRAWGELIARELEAGDIIGLSGELGAGKTVMIQGICRGLAVEERVTSSSFVLMRILQGTRPVYHFDLYRLDTIDELEGLGFEEYLFSDGISLIEWSEKLGSAIGDEYLQITIDFDEALESGRKIRLLARGKRFQEKLDEISRQRPPLRAEN